LTSLQWKWEKSLSTGFGNAKIGQEIWWWERALEVCGYAHDDLGCIGMPSMALLDPQTPQETRPMTYTKDAAIIAWGMNDVTFEHNGEWHCRPFEDGDFKEDMMKRIFRFTEALRHWPRSIVFCGHETWEEAYGPNMSLWTTWARQVFSSLGVTALPLDRTFEDFEFYEDNIHFLRTSTDHSYDWSTSWKRVLELCHSFLSVQVPWCWRETEAAAGRNTSWMGLKRSDSFFGNRATRPDDLRPFRLRRFIYATTSIMEDAPTWTRTLPLMLLDSP
jgi:hypothetical protein